MADQSASGRIGRRTAFTGLAAAVPIAAGLARPASGAGAGKRTFVLVHGAWHGAWCYQRVADRLTAAGHKVYTPTLTGLADRSHLMMPGITLQTHVDDVVNLMKWEDLTDIVLCGHSYGGAVVSGVAEAMLPQIASIVFLDAFMPESGQTIAELSPTSRENVLASQARGAISLPAPPARAFTVNPADQAMVDAKCTPQPIRTFTEGIPITGARERVRRKTYVRGEQYARDAFDAAYEKARQDPGWVAHKLPCGHDVMLDMPDRVAEILLQAAAG
jgi:pimeloyl-ACP methyl ester carboxylesterase